MLELPWELIFDTSELMKLDPVLVGAICMVESAGDPWAVRIELHWQYYLELKKYADLNRITQTTEKAMQACSWGLMQVMGSVAREHGYAGPLQRLCEPEIGIRYGCKHLAKFTKKYDSVYDVIASYNAGSPIKTMEGSYRNQQYVSKVVQYMNSLKEILRG